MPEWGQGDRIMEEKGYEEEENTKKDYWVSLIKTGTTRGQNHIEIEVLQRHQFANIEQAIGYMRFLNWRSAQKRDLGWRLKRKLKLKKKKEGGN